VRPIFKPYKHQVLSAAEYKAQRQQDLLKATAAAASSSSSHGSDEFDTQAGQQQQQQHQLQMGLGLQTVGEVHPGALGSPAAPGLSLPLSLPLESAAADAAAAFQQYLPPADVLHIADAAAAAAAATPQELLLPPAASLPVLRDSSSMPHSLTATSSSTAALLAALAAAQVRGSISDQLNMADDAQEHTAALLAATAAAAAAAPGSQPEVVGWVSEMSRDSVLGQALQLALSHAVRMQEPVMLPSGHKVFPDGRVVLCVVNNELGLMLPAGSQDLQQLEPTRAQVVAPFSAGGAGSSSSMTAGWGAADAHARVSGRAGPGLAGSGKDCCDNMAPAMLAAASAAAAVNATGAEQLAMDRMVEQQQ
jgi:hypothetical protein